jgi:hypothetical protein
VEFTREVGPAREGKVGSDRKRTAAVKGVDKEKEKVSPSDNVRRAS